MEREYEDGEPMSDAEYVERKGGICPFCRKDTIEGGPIEVDGDTCTQEVDCLSCGESWHDVYVLNGYYRGG